MGEILIFSSLFQKSQKFAGEWRKAVDVLRRICYNEENSGKRYPTVRAGGKILLQFSPLCAITARESFPQILPMENPMEEHSYHFFSPDELNQLTRIEAADRANVYLYRILDIGQYMLQCGGEVSRVEDSIRRLCIAFGAERADVFTITSSIVVTIYANHFGAVTQTRRIMGSAYDLQRLEQLNQLCRKICAEHLSLEETEKELNDILATPQYSFGIQLMTYALISASFSLFFGGSWLDALASGVIGVVLKCLDRLIRSTEANAFLSALLCSLLGGLLAGLSVKFHLGHNVDMISIGNIMLLIPGVALTNSLRDMFSGNTISGLMRFIEAILLALTIAFGFALAASLM